MSQSLPARLQEAEDGSGTWYVFYSKNKRAKRTRLRTKDKEIAELRFQGWLKQRDLEELMCEDPTVDFILDVWFEQWVEDRMSSVARVKSII